MNRPVLAFWYLVVIVAILGVAFMVAWGLVSLFHILPMWADVLLGGALALAFLYSAILGCLP